MILDNKEMISNNPNKVPSLDLLEKMIQCATLASHMFEEAAAGESTTSNYSSLMGANGVPAAASNNAREDTKESVLNGPTTNGSSATATGAPAPAPAPTSSGPPGKKQV